MRRRYNPLFYDGDLDATLRNQTAKITAKVDSINKDQLRATPEDDLVKHIFSEFEIVPLTLHKDSIEMEQHAR